MNSSRRNAANGYLLLIAAVSIMTTMVRSQKLRNASSDAEDPMHKLAKALAGSWAIEEKDEPGPQMPKGETFRGREIWKVLPGGMALMEQYRAKSSTGVENDSALIWWNAVDGRYQGIWCASFNMQGCTPFEVDWDRNQIVMSGKYQQGAKNMLWKEVFTIAPDSFVQTLDMAEAGSSLKRVATINATRQAKQKSTAADSKRAVSP